MGAALASSAGPVTWKDERQASSPCAPFFQQEPRASGGLPYSRFHAGRKAKGPVRHSGSLWPAPCAAHVLPCFLAATAQSASGPFLCHRSECLRAAPLAPQVFPDCVDSKTFHPQRRSQVCRLAARKPWWPGSRVSELAPRWAATPYANASLPGPFPSLCPSSVRAQRAERWQPRRAAAAEHRARRRGAAGAGRARRRAAGRATQRPGLPPRGKPRCLSAVSHCTAIVLFSAPMPRSSMARCWSPRRADRRMTRLSAAVSGLPSSGGSVAHRPHRGRAWRRLGPLDHGERRRRAAGKPAVLRTWTSLIALLRPRPRLIRHARTWPRTARRRTSLTEPHVHPSAPLVAQASGHSPEAQASLARRQLRWALADLPVTITGPLEGGALAAALASADVLLAPRERSDLRAGMLQVWSMRPYV
jgi:hypothetical protein